MQELKKIGVVATGKICGLFGVIFGLLVGILVGLSSQVENTDLVPQVSQAISGWSAAILMPIIYGIVYFLGGLIGAALYNLFSKWVGGIPVELEKSK